jgi:hypothetical protein
VYAPGRPGASIVKGATKGFEGAKRREGLAQRRHRNRRPSGLGLVENVLKNRPHAPPVDVGREPGKERSA